MCAVMSSAGLYSAVIRSFLNKAHNYSACRRSSSIPPNRRSFIWHSLWPRRNFRITFTLSASSHGMRTGLLRTIAMVWQRWSGDSRHACVRCSIAGEYGPAGTISDSASIEKIWMRGSTTWSDMPGIGLSSANPPQPLRPRLRRGTYRREATTALTPPPGRARGLTSRRCGESILARANLPARTGMVVITQS